MEMIIVNVKRPRRKGFMMNWTSVLAGDYLNAEKDHWQPNQLSFNHQLCKTQIKLLEDRKKEPIIGDNHHSPNQSQRNRPNYCQYCHKSTTLSFSTTEFPSKSQSQLELGVAIHLIDLKKDQAKFLMAFQLEDHPPL